MVRGRRVLVAPGGPAYVRMHVGMVRLGAGGVKWRLRARGAGHLSDHQMISLVGPLRAREGDGWPNFSHPWRGGAGRREPDTCRSQSGGDGPAPQAAEGAVGGA